MDSYDFHGLETIQCMVERRRGGETGVKSMQAYRGENFWKANKEGVWPRDLMESALCRSHTLTPAREGFNDIMPTMEDMQRLVKNPVAYRYEHNDGLKCTMLLMTGLVKDFNLRRGSITGIFSTQMYLPMPRRADHAREFLQSAGEQHGADVPHGKTDVSRGATLLTTGLTAAGVESLYRRADALRNPAPWRSDTSRPRVDVLEKLNETHCGHRINLQISVARAAHRGSLPRGISRPRHVAPARHEDRVLYIDQKPEGDQSAERAKEFGFTVYPTIAEALRCGGDKLAVDAVLSIVEHGDYPRNEKGQILYPRYEFFKQSSRCSRRTAARFPSITTSIFRGASRKRSGWWMRRSV